MYRILFFLLLCSHGVMGQDHHIAAVADVKPGLIRLRWAPSSIVGWEMGIKYGYNIERITVGVPGTQILTKIPILPYPLEKMDANNNQVAIVAEVIYGEKFLPEKSFGSFYEIQNKNEWRMAMALLSCDLSKEAAESAGLYFEDRDIRDGLRYIYRISLAQQPKNLLVDTAVVVAVPNLLSRPRELTVICGDKMATLAWKEDTYSAYIVERAANGGDFRVVSDLPVVSPHFRDTLPDNDHRYSYRVKGITPFGEYGPYSEMVAAMGMASVDDRPALDTIIVQDNQRIQIKWLLPGILQQQLSKIIITRAVNSKGPFVPIATFNKIAYSYTDQHPAVTNYYRIKGLTKQGKAIYSFPYFAQLLDTIPPAIPVALKGTIDSAGVVTLKWEADTVPDLLGYRVFRANHLKEEFTEVTKAVLTGVTFIDTVTIQTLSPSVCYKIIAVDKNYNTSPYSAPIQLKRPDIIPPSAPLFTKTVSTDSAIYLAWQNSSSEDAIRYSLFRINTKDSTRTLIQNWDTAHLISCMNDTTIQQGNTYYYELLVWDDAGNRMSETSSDVYFESGIRPPITTWKAEKQKSSIRLHWEYNAQHVKQYRIYRAKNNDLFTLYTTQEGSKNEFTDNILFTGNVYKYKITAVLQGDVKSAMSKVIEVIY